MSQQPPEYGQSLPPPPPPGQPTPQAPYEAQQPYGPQTRTDGMAIASLVCSLAFLVFCGLGIVTSILAIVFAKKADENIAAGGGMVTGTGLAKAGRIIGWVGIGLQVLVVVGYIAFFVVIVVAGNSGG